MKSGGHDPQIPPRRNATDYVGISYVFTMVIVCEIHGVIHSTAATGPDYNYGTVCYQHRESAVSERFQTN